jgi:hypothetical protein
MRIFFKDHNGDEGGRGSILKTSRAAPFNVPSIIYKRVSKDEKKTYKTNLLKQLSRLLG